MRRALGELAQPPGRVPRRVDTIGVHENVGVDRDQLSNRFGTSVENACVAFGWNPERMAYWREESSSRRLGS